jgi:hypothetical protein
MSIRQWLTNSGDKRRSPRVQPEDLVAYYWTGAVPRPSSVRDIGMYGAHIVAPAGFHFYVGTVVEIVFESRAVGGNNGAGSHHICVEGRVLRTVTNGFCVEFVFGDSSTRRRFRRFLGGVKRRNGDETNTEKASNVQRAGTD